MNLTAQLHDFIDGIVRHGEDPSCWPLARDEQIVFVRSTIYQARQIARSEPYLAQAVEMASEKLAEQPVTVGEEIEKRV